jgi:hypothetical protein
MDLRTMFKQGLDLPLGNHTATNHQGRLPLQVEKNGVIGHLFFLW